MKQAMILVVALVCLAAAGVVWYVFRTPFAVTYDKALKDFRAGKYALALPTLEQGARAFKGTPKETDALLWLARCESALNPANVRTWQTLAAMTRDRSILGEARYRLAVVQPNPEPALGLFVNEFPERPEARAVLAEMGRTALAQNDVMKAWRAWQTLCDAHPQSPEALAVRAALGDLNLKLLCSPRPLPFTLQHQVAPGEMVATIAKACKTSADSIKRINHLSSDMIRPGTQLKIDASRYLILIDTTKHELCLERLWQGATNYVKLYAVGTGKDENTPLGSFKITDKVKNPTWYKPGGKPILFGSKENQLGTRWLAIDCPGYGIHGTWEPDTVGKSCSAGCVRMKNEEVEELHDIVSLGTEVVIYASAKPQ